MLLALSFCTSYIACYGLLQKVQVSQHMKRSLSVPVNVKTRSVRRMDSMGSVMRVIPASPRTAAIDIDSPNSASVAEIGM